MEKNKCARCVYSCFVDIGDGGELLRGCVYILHHGKRRPCPGGEECTVFLPRKGGALSAEQFALKEVI